MRILVVALNREMNPEPPYPIGCAYVVSALRAQGHDVRTLDLIFEPDPRAAIERSIRESDPELVGLGIRNIDLMSFPNHKSEVQALRENVAAVRSVTGVPVVLGGSGFSLLPEACMETFGADAGIAGEAEVAFPALATSISLAGGRLPADLQGKVLRSPPGVDLDLISPCWDAFDVRRYYSEGAGGAVQTRRGCALPCSYCSYPLLEGRRVRERSADAVAREMALLRDGFGVDHVTIVDSVFNFPERHAMAVAEAMAALDPPVKWTGYFHPVFRDAGFFRLMKDSGCEGIDMGADSLSDTVLARMRKGFTAAEAIAFSDGCRTAGLRFNVSLLFGAPGETDATVRETIECVGRCDPDSVTVGIGVRLYPGAAVTEDLIAEGLVDRGSVGIDPCYYLADGVRETLMGALEREAERDKRWIIPGLDKNWNPRFFRRLRKHGRRGPIWHLVGG